MENRDMIRMANQIAAFFEAYPRSEALEGIAKHIRASWTPRMRQQLIDYIGAGAEGLSPLAKAALSPKPDANATAKASSKP
jgi:formate dehydrogenase subunit delta